MGPQHGEEQAHERSVGEGGDAVGRRSFMTGMAGLVAVAAAGCASGPSTPTTPAPGLPSGLSETAVPSREEIYDWITQVFSQGVRRPGYPADVWTEQFIKERFTSFGLQDVHFEPITVRRWRSNGATLKATPAVGPAKTIDCFPVPFSKKVTNLRLDLAGYVGATPSLVANKASLYDLTLLRLPATTVATFGSGAALELTSRIVDPGGTLLTDTHLLPFGLDFDKVMEPSIAGGAKAFIGNLANYPGKTHQYFVPYDAIDRPIPGVWISSTDGAWLHQKLLLGGVRVELTVDSRVDEVESHNVVGDLPGADDEIVIIGSHHDGPWSSAVEDASGTALVLAQAKFWAGQSARRRPHRLRFLVHGGHMSGGAGLLQYIDAHRAELGKVVLETHLEHAALDFEERADGQLASRNRCVPRWWFTSRNPQLEGFVRNALNAEGVDRSLLMAPDAIGEQPPTDGAFYHNAGVPIVQHLAAPWYLFDERDTLDKVDKASLVKLTRAVVRIVDATRGVSAAAMRAGVVSS